MMCCFFPPLFQVTSTVFVQTTGNSSFSSIPTIFQTAPRRSEAQGNKPTEQTNASRMLLQSWNCMRCIGTMRLPHQRFYSILIIAIIVIVNHVTAYKRNAIHDKNYISKVRLIMILLYPKFDMSVIMNLAQQPFKST